MLDPLTSLAIACAVAQFVDFGATLLERAYKISKSTDAGLSELTELEELIARLQSLGQRLEKVRAEVVDPNQHITVSDDEASAVALALSCEQLAGRIALTFQDLKVQGQPNMWDSLKLAYAIGRKKKELAKHKSDCEKLKERLLEHMMASIYSQNSRLTKTLNDIQRRNGLMEAKLTGKLDVLRADLTRMIPSPDNGLRGVKRTATVISDRSLASALSSLLDETRLVSASQRVLDSLRYEYMEARRSAVAVRHAQTFEWIYRSSDEMMRDKGVSIHFTEWLQSGDGIFWVSGKAGSGKSTLMKFLSTHKRTATHLKAWASGSRVVVATHFFWNAGSMLQKSQHGLLRSLCYEVLLQCPQLIPLMGQDRPDFTDERNVWTLDQLRDLVEWLKSQKLEADGRRVRFCFFVDGLDEYDGDHLDIISVLRRLASADDIKICASSRPWNVFQNAFCHDQRQMLVLQDLTRDDIALYVKEKLEEDPRFVELQQEDVRSRSLVEDVTQKANGVFLWVALVVRQLLKSLGNADDVHDLNRRLQELPPGLEEYFQHMFDVIDEFYNQQTAQMFQVCIWSQWPLALVSYAVLEMQDPTAARVTTSHAVETNEIDRLLDRLKRRINGRCQDLLEVTIRGSASYPVVDFLHRTVRDFLLTRDMHDLLAARAGVSFNVLTTLCRMSLVEVRRLRSPGVAFCEAQAHSIRHLFRYARAMEVQQNAIPLQELLGLADTLAGIPANDIQAFSEVPATDPKGRVSLIPLAVHEGLFLYLQEMVTLNRNALQAHAKVQPSLLRLALENFSGDFAETKSINPDVVRLLLQHNADPNARGLQKAAKQFHHPTPWLSFLGNIGSNNRDCTGTMRNILLLTTEALICGGAEYQREAVLLGAGRYTEWKSEKEVFSLVFGQTEAERLQHLRASGRSSFQTVIGVVHDSVESVIKSLIGVKSARTEPRHQEEDLFSSMRMPID